MADAQKRAPTWERVVEAIGVSLVIPVRNEERSLPRLIASIRAQTRLPDEVILVDGGSTDGTVALARQLTAHDPRWRIVEAGPATPGRGRNVGIAAARYEWIALTDAGIRLEPDWLEQLVAVAASDPGLAIVYGNYEPVTDSFFTRCAALAYVPPREERPGGRMRGPFIASSLVRRQAWEAVGGFPDLRAAEDLIFFERLSRAGLRAGWAPRATVWWEIQPSLLATFRRFVLYSRHNVWAGRQAYWHYGLARQYLMALPFLGLALLHSAWWLVVPLLAGSARVAKSLWRRREGRGVAWLLNPIRFLGVAVVLLAVDLATFVGWAQARWGGPPPAPRKDGSGMLEPLASPPSIEP